MSTALILAPTDDLLPAPMFAPTPRAAQRFIEFFAAQINNDHLRRSYLNATRRFAARCDAIASQRQFRKGLACSRLPRTAIRCASTLHRELRCLRAIPDGP